MCSMLMAHSWGKFELWRFVMEILRFVQMKYEWQCMCVYKHQKKQHDRVERIACFDKENTIHKTLLSGVRLRDVS